MIRRMLAHLVRPRQRLVALCASVAAVGALGWREKLLKISLIGTSLAATLGVLELPALLGVLDYRQIISPSQSALFTRIKPWENPRSNLIDRELLHLHRPGLHFVGEAPGDLVGWLGIATTRKYQVDIQYDQHGFRNNHDLIAAKVLAIGDSFIEAGIVPQEQTLPMRLAADLRAPVANLGQSGYGPQQELVVLQRFGLKLDPELVLWFFFEGNDLLDTARYQQVSQTWEATIQAQNGFKSRSFTRNALFFAGELFAGSSPADGEEARRRSCTLTSAHGTADQTLYFGYNAAPLTANDLASLSVAEGALLEANAATVASGAKFVLVFVPITYRVYHDLCDYPPDGYGRTWQLSDLPTRLGAWAAANNIAYLDLTPPLRAAAANGELVYFTDDGHWNSAGNAVGAAAVEQLAAVRPWVDAAAAQDGQPLLGSYTGSQP